MKAFAPFSEPTGNLTRCKNKWTAHWPEIKLAAWLKKPI